MNLFLTDQKLNLINEDPLKLRTPLGILAFEASINDELINIDSVSSIKSSKSNNVLVNWNTNNYIIDLLKVEFNLTLLPNLEVDKCFAVVWRIKAFKNLNINLNCYLNTLLEGFSESGEYLICQSFETSLTKLSIGTEDDDKLQRRAIKHDWVPNRFKTEINLDNFYYLDEGLKINFELFKEEKIQIHFVVAWSSKENRDTMVCC